MPTSHRFALLALGPALALCACNLDARSQPGRAPQAPLAWAGLSEPASASDADCKAANPSNASGRCAPRPQVCPMIYHPVCGSDGKTYANACHAERAGVNLAHEGACER